MTASETFSCAQCSRIFQSLSRYNQHLKTHSKPFGCSKCKSSFALRADLNRHVRARHRTGLYEYSCQVSGCKYMAARKDNLRRHMQNHADKDGRTSNKNHASEDVKDSKTLDVAPLTASPESCKIDADPQALLRVMLQAVNTGNMVLLDFALKSGLSLSVRTDDGSTLLHCAARAGQVNMVHHLLATGANQQILNKKERTPFQEAIIGQDYETFKLLLQHRADTESRFSFYRRDGAAIILSGSDEILRLYMNYLDCDLTSAQELYLICLAARYGKNSIMKVLLAIPGANLNALDERGVAPLHYAVRHGHMEVTKTLISQDNINLNILTGARHWTPLYLAISAKNLGMVALLLSHKECDIYHVSPWYISQLLQSLIKGPVEMILLLFSHRDFNIKHQFSSASTLLHQAASINVHPSHVALLLQHKDIQINSRDAYGETPLHAAALRGHNQLVKLLLDCKGIDIDGKTYSSHWNRSCREKSPLQLARQGDHTHAADLLLQYGALDDSSEVGEEVHNSEALPEQNTATTMVDAGLSDWEENDIFEEWLEHSLLPEGIDNENMDRLMNEADEGNQIGGRLN